jgi:hypothetical protein
MRPPEVSVARLHIDPHTRRDEDHPSIGQSAQTERTIRETVGSQSEYFVVWRMGLALVLSIHSLVAPDDYCDATTRPRAE